LRKECFTWYHTFNFDAHLAAYEAIYTETDKQFRSDRIIDATGLSGKSEYFLDHVHPTKAGCDALSELVFRFLTRNSSFFSQSHPSD
jgi:hypothetical protein